MSIVAPPTTTLQAIQTKVRRLTRSPSSAQLTDTDLQNYINTFIVYDFPETLRTFKLRQQFSFVCNPYQDTYITNATLPTTNPLYNFENIYLTMHQPIYIAGFQSFFTQSRTQMFAIYPMLNSIMNIGVRGNGVQTSFTGVVTNNSGPVLNPNVQNQSSVLLQGQVLFDSIDSNGLGLSLIDVPVQDTGTGFNTVNGNLYVPGTEPDTRPTVVDPTNTINYVTGAYTITFKTPGGAPVAPGPDRVINSQTVPSITARPQALMFYENVFTLRPVPDQPYKINFEVDIRPTAILDTTFSPELEEWWQYIAYGAAKKIFEDRMEMESVANIMPEFNKQERLCLRRTLVQLTNERVATIYSEQTGTQGGWNWWSFGSGG